MYRLLLILSVSLIALSISAQQQQRPRRVTGNTDQTNTGTQKPSGNDSQDLEEGDVIRTDTQLVSVPAVVTDSAGHPLAGLKPENFRISEDGQAQTITNFGTAETPFEIALLLDTSGSTRDDVALIRDAALSFIGALRPGDRVGVIAFNTTRKGPDSVATVDVLSLLTSDRDELHKAIENLGSSNGTPYYDALQKVVDSVFHDPPRDEVRGRRAVVALTDGVDSQSNSDFTAARLKLSQAGVACYFVQINTEESSRAGRPAFAVWDFSGAYGPSLEPVPKDANAKMRWYWEPVHYKRELGDLMLNRILRDIRSPEWPGFGVNLEAGNIEAHLAGLRDLQRSYAAEHPEAIAEIRALINKANYAAPDESEAVTRLSR